ncbi:type II toxin-antitoxin system prevent-host-death family antitoxin [Rhizobium sp. DKSPLA3]|uniref:Type II toxin-antitoxin system prevent-host-death family antitoxin n=1 Tax=Rhizobium quercicola TaxID=2901226 RepID=A0A9X1T2V5_9HYPH|nr:type II toxin-antitoxin system prevent-host-death family antitoxin [Rhizobium quercicola]
MKILVEIGEAAERLEELIELAARQDEIMICRDGRPIAVLTSIASRADAIDEWTNLAAESRANLPPGTTSNHDDLYDEHGLPI